MSQTLKTMPINSYCGYRTAYAIIAEMNIVGGNHNMTLPDTLTQRLQTIAESEGRTPEAFLQALLDAYEQRTIGESAVDEFIGAFDDDVTDLSTTVRETLRQRFQTDHDSSA